MIVGCIGGVQVNCCAWILIGWAQTFLTFCLIGWIWSILVGLQIYRKANSPKVNVTLLA